MSFSYRTMRVRWLMGSVVPEYSVITGLRIAVIAMLFSIRRSGRPKALTSPQTSVDVLPVFLLKQIGENQEHQQEQDHEDPDPVALQFRRLAEVDQKVRQVTHGLVVLLLAHRARAFGLELLEHRRAVRVLEHRALMTLPLV